ncbi:uncharacterized protein LOC132731760 [Ruditapes philippinarum]|uniref:uncharacterized protein LOC132731760 n=1 Tax=Ruditapes philippinarum TaxID=129788 RepID=UPI00295B9724|nr:uncharacterized protein LOC132731760 [Ruditapes philippinarum]
MKGLKTDSLQEIIMTTVVLSLAILLLNSRSSLAAPIEKRSQHLPIHLFCDSPITVGDGLLRDMMFLVGDEDMDGLLSEHEIASFYRETVHYTDYVAQTYGRSFIEIADLDHDGTLNPDEMLCMLSAMSASSWTRR